jgi:hypothetical protein
MRDFETADFEKFWVERKACHARGKTAFCFLSLHPSPAHDSTR